MGLLSFQVHVRFDEGLGFSPLGETGEGFVGLQAKHPENHNIKVKTQSGQQLQFLRDKGAIEFLGRGHYRMRNV
jgi:hypothetical protein